MRITVLGLSVLLIRFHLMLLWSKEFTCNTKLVRLYNIHEDLRSQLKTLRMADSSNTSSFRSNILEIKLFAYTHFLSIPI